MDYSITKNGKQPHGDDRSETQAQKHINEETNGTFPIQHPTHKSASCSSVAEFRRLKNSNGVSSLRLPIEVPAAAADESARDMRAMLSSKAAMPLRSSRAASRVRFTRVWERQQTLGRCDTQKEETMTKQETDKYRIQRLTLSSTHRKQG